ncbi:Aminomethyltransferase [Tribonema minus]|uniref:Aminomethyltransferase n=1 Tax=Tribonema minus TaxID=303371 RepID=A0A836CJF5_9STRA|nr:Aminomethyltransferase [Tribonema minus]
MMQSAVRAAVRSGRTLARAPAAVVSRRTMATDEPLEKTAYYDMHVELKGKMVPFAGYSLPVLYETEAGGVLKETLNTRALGCSGLFDVSHMGQLRWTGKDAVKFIEHCVVGDIAGLKPGEGRLSLITDQSGGIIDDTVITNAGSYVYMVINGACKHSDMDHFRREMASFNGDVHMEYLAEQQLLALQGPGAAAALAPLLPSSIDLAVMPFMTGVDCKVAGIEGCRVTRCGYTGEDGFEISVPFAQAVNLAQSLLKHKGVMPTGLGARDALRLEAGLCLYGNDIDLTTNPVEAGLAWTMGGVKGRRRTEQGFLGADKFLQPDGKLKKVTRKRVGIAGMKAPARGHTEIFDAEGKTKIGEITSGTFSPCLKRPLAMGYVAAEHSKTDTPVMLSVRGKLQPAVVSSMPFVETRYFKPAA